jgi:hypothetical protein
MVRVAVNNTQSCIEMTARSTIIIEGAAQRSNLFRNRIRVTLVAVQQAKRGGFRKRIMQGLSAWNCYNFEHAMCIQICIRRKGETPERVLSWRAQSR